MSDTSNKPVLRRIKLRPLPLHISFNHMLPNAITLLSLCSGLSGIRFAMMGKWEHVLFAILVATICDTLDGRVARLLKGTSQFGAELDSLVDAISFGVAPAMIIYLWALQDAGPLGWISVLVFACCNVLRLARFNASLANPNPLPFAAHFFTGVPAPAGAGLALFPLIVSVGMTENGLGTLADQHWLLIPWMLLVGGLMISKMPTYSGKKLKVSREVALLILMSIATLIALIITVPWLGLTVFVSIYLLSLPIAVVHYYRLSRALDIH